MTEAEEKILDLFNQIIESKSALLAHGIDEILQPLSEMKWVTKEQINDLINNLPLKIAVKATDFLKQKYNKRFTNPQVDEIAAH